MPLIHFTERGLYCPRADVYIDPWLPVSKTLITHAHADHARPRMGSYLSHHDSVAVMRQRLGDISAEGVRYGEKKKVNGVEITFLPAGHIPGSAQIRLASEGEVWVISGDYKLENDGLCEPFEPVKCSHFVTESTFALPVYQWDEAGNVMASIERWWQQNSAEGLCTVLQCYSLGKAQRLLHALSQEIGEIFVHGAIHNTNEALKTAGYKFPHAQYLDASVDGKRLRGAMVLAPPSAIGSSWLKKLKPCKVGAVSGWMSLRGTRRRKNFDRGFVLSDHADWKGLNTAVLSSGAEHVYVTHGYSHVFAKWLRSQGYQAQAIDTAFGGEDEDAEQDEPANPESN